MPVRRATVTSSSTAATLALASEALERGELVLLPTETVYGIAARADRPQALERLRACKGRDSDQPFSVHVGVTPGERARLALPRDVTFPGIAGRLVHAFWPGPLTLVVETADAALAGVAVHGMVGLRAPHHKFTTALLAELDFPVVLSSANASGAPPTVDVDAAFASLGARADDLALAVDAGPTATAQTPLASSVLILGRGRFELAREGLLNLDDLRRAAGLSIGFICSGNTCRSPLGEFFAEIELRGALGADPADFGFAFSSMGLAAGPGMPASPHSMAIARAAGGSLKQHRSQQADLDALFALDRIYTMTAAHRDHILAAFGPAAEHADAPVIETLHPSGRNIQDPYGGNRADYDLAAQDIRSSIQARLSEWL